MKIYYYEAHPLPLEESDPEIHSKFNEGVVVGIVSDFNYEAFMSDTKAVRIIITRYEGDDGWRK